MSRPKALRFEKLEPRRVLSGTPITFELLTDVNTSNSAHANPAGTTVLDGFAYFYADDGVTGVELWRTDGENVELIEDIRPGGLSSSPEQLFVYDGDLYFTADDGVHGREVWRHDPTSGTTELLIDISQGNETSSPGDFTLFNGLLYFRADDGIHGAELWLTNGTAVGTILAADLRPGDDPSDPYGLTVVGDELFFSAYYELGGRTLWRSDGTLEGSDQITSDAARNPISLVVVGDTLFFVGRSQHSPSSYWLAKANDGTEVAEHVRDFDRRPESLVSYQDELYFYGYEHDGRKHSLWRSDGTLDGTSVVDTLVSSTSEQPIVGSVVIDGLLYLRHKSSVSNRFTLWRSDGTETGTFQLTDFFQGGTSLPVAVGDTLLFVNKGELWKTDGTVEGTVEVAELNQEFFENSEPRGLVTFGDRILFSADDSVFGRELWKSDGTAEGTQLLADLRPLPSRDAYPRDFIALGERLYFRARSGDNEDTIEFWSTDGTAAGTYRVKDIANAVPGTPISNNSVLSLAPYGDQLVLKVKSGPSNEELWISDGTEAGTNSLKALNPHAGGLAFGRPAFFADAGGLKFFRSLTERDSTSTVWRTDGTSNGTFTVGEGDGEGGVLASRGEIGVGDLLYFFGYDGNDGHGYELWRSDGTDAGTYLVKDIYPGTLFVGGFNGFRPNSSKYLANSVNDYTNVIAVLKGRLFFSADDGVHGTELWTSDGTSAGTVLLADLNSGEEGSLHEAAPMVNFGDHVYFAASADGGSSRLWRTDGTSVEQAFQAEVLFPAELTAVGDTLYFSGIGADGKRDLWRFGASDTAPHRFEGLHLGDDMFFPRELSAASDTLYFSADDGVHGRELWRVVGPDGSPELIADIVPGPEGSDPEYVYAWGDQVVVSAMTDEYGVEVWIGRPSLVGDYDQDGLVTRSDQALWRATYGSSDDLRADGNSNGRVDTSDYVVWRDAYQQLLGDYNFDGTVDASDDSVWRETHGSTTDLRADSNGDGVVNAADFTTWREQLPIDGDYDRDGVVSSSDHTLWSQTYGSDDDLRADGNGDGIVNAADFTAWRENLPPSQPAMLGDYDGNGTVDGQDYAAWGSSYGSTSDTSADGNGDGVVGADDYTVWRENEEGNVATVAAATPQSHPTPPTGARLPLIRVSPSYEAVVVASTANENLRSITTSDAGFALLAADSNGPANAPATLVAAASPNDDTLLLLLLDRALTPSTLCIAHDEALSSFSGAFSEDNEGFLSESLMLTVDGM